MFSCVNQRLRCFIIAYFVLLNRPIKVIFNVVSFLQVFEKYEKYQKYGDGSENVHKSLAIILAQDTVVVILDIISAIILLVGLYKSNCRLILAYLVSTTLYFVLDALLVLSCAGVSAGTYRTLDWTIFGIEILYKCICIHCIRSISKYYVTLSNKEEPTCVYKNEDLEFSKPEYVA